MKKHIALFLTVIMILAIMLTATACNSEKAPSADKIIEDVLASEQAAAPTETDSSINDLDITVMGKSTDLPFNVSTFLNNGYEFMDDEESKKIQTGNPGDLYNVVLDNNGNWVNVNLHTDGTLESTTVIGFTLVYPENDVIQINGFKKGDSTSDLVDTLKEYEHNVITGDESNIKTEDYVVEYLFSDGCVTIYSTKNKIDNLFVTLYNNAAM